MQTGSSPRPGESPNRWWLHAVILSGLLLGNLALYYGAIGLDFLSVDDPDYVQNNRDIESFKATNLKRIFTRAYVANYAPANILSYSLDVKLAGGRNARAFHLSNVLWHGCAVCAVYFLAWTIRREVLTAAAASMLFLLHPAHVEVVAWVSCRKDLVGTTFAVLSMSCYLLYRGKARRSSWWYSGSVLSFLIASAGKQSVLLLPAVMLVWDLLVEKRKGWQMLADKAPFGLITLFFGLMTWHAQPPTHQPRYAFIPAATQFVNLWLLSGLGQYALYRTAPNPAAWTSFARVALVVGAALAWVIPLVLTRPWSLPLPFASAAPSSVSGKEKSADLKKRGRVRKTAPAAAQNLDAGRTSSSSAPVVIALCFWVLIQMVPPMVLNFVVPITDRYLFLSSVGVCTLLAVMASGLTRKLRARGWWISCVLLAGLGTVWGIKTHAYLAEWQDPRSVWYGAHLKTSSSQVSQFLGEVYQNTGDRIDGFIKTGARLRETNENKFARAVLGQTQAAALLAEWNGQAQSKTNSLAYRDKLWGLAWEQYQESAARRGTLSAPNLYMNRGRLLVNQGKSEQAISEFQKALGFAKTSTYEVIRQETGTHALYAIGVAHWHLRNYREARQWLLQAQELQNKSAQKWIPALDHEVERINALAAPPQ